MRCRKLRRCKLSRQYMEGRLFMFIPVRGGDAHAAKVTCVECSYTQPIANERYPHAEPADPQRTLHALTLTTNPRVVAQTHRILELRHRGRADALCDTLTEVVGAPVSEELLALAEAEIAAGRDPSADVLQRVRDKNIELHDRTKADELAWGLSSSYPRGAGLAAGFAIFVTTMSLPALLAKSSFVAWVVAFVAAAALTRTVIGRLRRRSVAEYVDRTLRPELERAQLSAALFLDVLERYRNGTLRQASHLQDMASDHALLAELIAGQPAQ
jgi:hypothetical protein